MKKRAIVYLGADHAGFKLKEKIKDFLKKNYIVIDEGAHSLNKDDDYPDFAKRVGNNIRGDSKGILICGSSQGVCIAANKIKGIRAVSISDVKNAVKSREHLDANVLCLSGWELTEEKAKKIISAWLKTKFSKAQRHNRRLNKIRSLENAK